MICFLWLIFLLIIGKFFYILFRQKEERPIPKQFVIKARNGKRTIIILRNNLGGDLTMAKINKVKLKTLKQTRAFYNYELKKEGLTGKERASYLLALKSIKKIIREKENSGEKEKRKAAFRRGY